MIFVKSNVFHLNTKNTSYVFHITKYGDLEHLYYGKRIDKQENYNALIENRNLLLVSTLYPDGDITYSIDDMCFEYSFSGSGDMRESACTAYSDNTLCRFKYDSFVTDNKVNENPNPTAHNADENLIIILKDDISKATLYLHYGVFYECDCITRSSVLLAGEKGISIRKIMSLQLDLNRNDLKLLSFNGAWSRERQKQEQELNLGKVIIDSQSGASSARHNPFVMLAQKNADNFIGDTYAFNLIYSGNHCETAEVCPYGKTRFLTGISPDNLEIRLSAGESFFTPEAVMTCSEKGYNGVSLNMHSFVKKHIIPEHWQNREKPVLLNSWEAMYFDITEEKILALAEKALEIDVELLVVDDGWFGNRNDDTSSLGDWYENKEKFPNGIKELSERLHNMGLKFGLWFEPEMISRNSNLFKKHPEWVMGNLQRNPVISGRNQYILDLSQKAVQDYIISSLSKCISDFNIDYIKWDYNRMFSDISSEITPIGEVQHKYILGLYRILSELTDRYPGVLFELCASGGARFDLGMLCYMPVGWTSDNTDVYSRMMIQEGTSYGYPPSVMCNHISICPNHQTKRNTDLQSRFSAASMGIMGLQYNLLTCDEDTLNELKSFVECYKTMRNTITNGDFYRLIDGFENNFNSWMLIDKNKEIAYILLFQKLFSPVTSLPKIKLIGLSPKSVYKIESIGLQATGEILMNNGIILPQNYQGNEISQHMSDFTDFTARIYKIERVKL